MEMSEAARQLKVELSRHLPEAATPSEKKRASKLAGESLREYFALAVDSNLTIPWTVEDLELYSESDIDQGQIGYRWYPKDYGSSDVLDDWHANWLVLGQRSGDPVILDQDTGAVMMAYHGMGEWTPEIVAQMSPILLAFWLSGFESRSGNSKERSGMRAPVSSRQRSRSGLQRICNLSRNRSETTF